MNNWGDSLEREDAEKRLVEQEDRTIEHKAYSVSMTLVSRPLKSVILK